MSNNEPKIGQKDLKNLEPGGAIRKVESEDLICEDPECQKPAGVLYGVTIKQANDKGQIVKVEKKYCEASYNAYWAKNGYKP